MAIVNSTADGLRAASRATILQLRAPELSARALEREATELVAKSAVPVLVSSRCDVALVSGAAGVNLPERDVTVAAARALLGSRLIGRSVHSLEGGVDAQEQGADYVIFGPVWASPSHAESSPAGIDALAAVARALRIPVIAIGGVTAERIEVCRVAGAAGYAAIRLFE